MLIGLLLRDFKSYKGINYVPLIKKESHIFTAISGVNGIGKSAIFESLDVFFNDSRWNLRKNGKRNEAVVAPVFIVPKNEINKGAEKQLFEKLSNFFIQLDGADFPTNLGFRDACEHRESLAIDYSKYYYIICPHLPFLKSLDKDKFDGPFALESIQNKLILYKFTQKEDYEEDYFELFSSIKDKLTTIYSYVYYPAECRVDDVTKIHANEMKCLTGRDLEKEIDQILNIANSGNSGGKSIFESISSELENFLSQLNTEIAKIDSNYKYKTKQGVPQKMSVKGLRECIIDTYFRSKALKYETMELEDLSSGQQRKALLDVAYAFLSGGSKPQKKVIFAIDEPELSMHADACYDQFKRVSDLAMSHGLQTMVTTHWYGFLPMAIKSSWLHIPLSESVTNSYLQNFFDLEKGFEERSKFPDEIAVRSIFDFASSIFSIAKNHKQNWLICEGSDDANYLRHFLNNSQINSDIKIVPVGGSGLVMKIFSYLKVLASDEGKKNVNSGKILCLIDSDKIRIPCENSSDVGDNIFLRRLQMTGDTISLVRPSAGGEYSQTEIEDCIPSAVYWKAIVKYAGDIKDDKLFSILDKIEPNFTAKCSGISLNTPAFVARYSGELSDLQILKEYIIEKDAAKRKICEIIVSNKKNAYSEVIEPIAQIFNFSVKSPATKPLSVAPSSGE